MNAAFALVIRSRHWVAAITLFACGLQSADGFVFRSDHLGHVVSPGNRLTMDPSMGTTPGTLIAGGSSWDNYLESSLTLWNQIGVGPGLDHSFFSYLSPSVAGDSCSADGVNKVVWASSVCGQGFGTAIAITKTWYSTTTFQATQVDTLFDTSRPWNVYSGPLRQASAGGTLFDMYRTATHEMGHALGLDHPDENGQSVVAIMNANISDIDSPQADDINGAHAVNWGSGGNPPPPPPPPPPTPTTYVSVALFGTGTGTVTSSPAGLTCPPTCTVPSSTWFSSFNLIETPGPLSVFAGWGGDCSFAGLSNIVASFAPGQVSCTATFNLVQQGTINIIVQGPGQIDWYPGGARDGLSCPTLCSRSFPVGSFMVLAVTYLPGATSVIWGGDCAGMGTGPVPSASFPVREGTMNCTATFSTAPPSGGNITPVSSTLGSRGTVSASGVMYGGFTLVSRATVYILARGDSLGTLGITQGFLDAPELVLYNSQGVPLAAQFSGTNSGITGCTDSGVLAYYQSSRGAPVQARDACASRTLDAGAYTFTIQPSAIGRNGDTLSSTPATGEVLFEATIGGGGSAGKTQGSRGTVSSTGKLYGGFQVTTSGGFARQVYILVRGPSLGSLGVTTSFVSPSVQIFNSAGNVIASGVGCTGSVASYYQARGAPTHPSDYCAELQLPNGVYTFAVAPAVNSFRQTGEVLFEVTHNPNGPG